MKSLTIRQFDEKKEEIADALISLGISRTVARALSYLQGSNEVTSVEFEREAGLRQPEVSIVMRD
jgi:predicted transcriptional regulator